MNANLKLLKKKRIAHIGSKLPNGSCEESRLQPDDFVYNIMKDMDSKKDVYQQLQDSKSQKRREPSINEDDLNFLQNKKAKRILPKKTFPLMKKCQTSLQHLKKNMCIPKPRAHVGVVSKPQRRPILIAPQSVSKVGCSNVRNIATKPDKRSRNSDKTSTSGAVSQRNLKVTKDSKQKCVPSTETVYPATQASQVKDYSSSDDEIAFENFVQENRCDSSDSDSRIVIRRKRSKTKSRSKKKSEDHSPPHKKLKKKLPKVTSMPLSDSSESESREIPEVGKKNTLTSCTYSEEGTNFQKTTGITNTSDKLRYSDLSDCSLVDACSFNYDSSDSESNLAVTSSRISDSKKCSRRHSNSNPNRDASLSVCEPTKRVPKYNLPCYVRLRRDPVLDEKAAIFCSRNSIQSLKAVDTYEDKDCIIISEDSDNDELSEVPKLNSICNTLCDDTEPEDCVIMCEVPKQDLLSHSNFSNNNSALIQNAEKPVLERENVTMASRNLTNFDKRVTISSIEDSCNTQGSHVKTANDGCVPTYEDKSDTGTDAHSVSNAIKQETDFAQDETPEFNLQIVAVHSLIESDQPLANTNVPEANYVELIDLSDDDLQMPNVEVEKSNLANEEDFSMSEVNQNESDVYETNNDISSNTPDPKILETLSKIDFDCLKKVLDKINLDNSKELLNVDGSSCSNTDLPACASDIIVKKVNSDVTKESSQNTPLIIDESIQSITKGDCQSTDTKFTPLFNENQESCNLLIQYNKPSHEHQNLEVSNSDTISCNNSYPLELQIKTVPMDSKTALKTIPQITKINKGLTCNVGDEKNNQIKKDIKNEGIESPEDELDIIAASYIEDLNPPDKKVLTLLNLYKSEYEKYKNIKNTEINVSAGLKLLHANQVKKLVHLRSSIKNLVKHDACFYKANEDSDISMKSMKIESSQAQSSKILQDVKREDHESSSSTVVNCNTAGPSKEKMLQLLKECKCAQCGKPATARCQGCAVVYYCSPNCGIQSWKEGHFAVCKRMKS